MSARPRPLRRAWSEAEDKRLRQLRGQGFSWTESAAALGRGIESCRQRWDKVIVPRARGELSPMAARKAKAERVKCLTCDKMFEPPDRRQVHMCEKCNNRISGRGLA